jgi:hypothetical protein
MIRSLTSNVMAIVIVATIAIGWWWSGIVGHRRRLDLEDAALLARTEQLPPAGRDTDCPRCGGSHCWPWRQAGADCGAQHAPALVHTMWTPQRGVHEPVAVLRRIVPGGWRPPRPLWSTLAERVGGFPVGVLP